MKGKNNMAKKEKQILLKLYQMDLWDLEEWQAGNPASSFSDKFIDEVTNLRDSLEYEMRVIRQENMDYNKQEDRISDDPEIR
jgi:hypothetical protein